MIPVTFKACASRAIAARQTEKTEAMAAGDSDGGRGIESYRGIIGTRARRQAKIFTGFLGWPQQGGLVMRKALVWVTVAGVGAMAGLSAVGLMVLLSLLRTPGQVISFVVIEQTEPETATQVRETLGYADRYEAGDGHGVVAGATLSECIGRFGRYEQLLGKQDIDGIGAEGYLWVIDGKYYALMFVNGELVTLFDVTIEPVGQEDGHG